MMNKKYFNITIFTITILFLYSLLFLSCNQTHKYKELSVSNNIDVYKNMNIKKENVDVSYPRFNEMYMDKIITDYVYTYVKEFIADKKSNKKLNITYEVYVDYKYINIFFNIDNSLNKDKYKNILIDTIHKKEVSINQIYDENDLKEKIYELIKNKYTKEEINLINMDEATYYLQDEYMIVYFTSVSLPFIPSINVDRVKEKYVVFTFDDGPSKYTKDIVDLLNEYDYSATFFVVGNKMKDNSKLINYIIDNNCEVGSHSYTHKNYTLISNNEIIKDINNFNILYKEITSKEIKVFRPPYGEYNNYVLEANPSRFVLWSLDTKDWLHRDKDYIYNYIKDNIKEGDIVLLHDLYYETYESLKLILPYLKDNNYKVVSIENMLNIYNNDEKVIKSFKKH